MGTTGHAATAITATPCATCHGATAGIAFQGVTPVFKPSNHVLTGADCSICHTLYTTFAGIGTGWKMSTNEHLNVTGTCVSCHTGQTFATGITPMQKSFIALHIPTTLTGFLGDACSNCHTSTAYPNGFKTVKMNHGTFGPTGVTATGTFNTPTSCSQCHGKGGTYTASFKSTSPTVVTMGSHQGSKSTDDCNKSGCHKPSGSKGKPYTTWN
jgi:hypothetical protein